MSRWRELSWLAHGQNRLLLLSLVLIAVAVFAKPIRVRQPVYSFQLAIDITQSMDVQDVTYRDQPVSRLELAKRSSEHLLHNLPCGSKLGWSVFTGRRTLILTTPLEVCEHHNGLLAVLQEINGSMRWSNGSQLGKGIYQLMRAAHDMDNDIDIIFISDGHEAPPMEQGQRGIQKTDQFKASGILLGVGGVTPTPIPKTLQDGRVSGVWGAAEVVQRPGTASGEEFSRRHDAHLSMLANLAGLKYEVLTTDSVLTRTIATGQLSQSHQSDYDFRWIAALSALLILCLRFMPSMGDLGLKSRWQQWRAQ